MSEIQERWFVARTRKDQEFSLRDSLKKLNVEFFLPTRFVIRQLKYRRKEVEVPVIRNLIFVHATKEKACFIAND
ncbi:Transcription antitermination protein RfaH, partial [termite gut metagenome]